MTRNECSQFKIAQTSTKRSYEAVTALTEVSLNAPAASVEYKTALKFERVCAAFHLKCVC